ncbi:MAG TPA: helix-turn-helix transcriptional regulator [Cellvibrionaceae bacterium]
MSAIKSTLAPDVLAVAVTFGANIKEARIARGWRQYDMAQRMLVSVPTLQAIEAGKVTVSLENYLRALDVLNMAEQIAAVASPHTDEEGRRLKSFGRVRI